MVAIMLEQLEIFPGCKTLEIGTGTGYNTALLAELGAKIWSIELIPELLEFAKSNLAAYSQSQVHLIAGDGSAGLPTEAPFDRILVTAGAPNLPRPLVDQLAEDGRMV